ncbi:MAG TPA: hypothetical protein VK698_22200 [Kofleriaceae bacterium]|nr:hypothetical protein [Kofleriaceae bacterium]
MISARRLLAWGDLEDRRRRVARRPLARISPWLVSGLAGILFVAEVLRRTGALTGGDGAEGDAGALRLWLALTAGVHVLVLFGSPHRLYWRRDAALQGRLPIAGGPLYRLTLLRSARAAGRAALPCAMAALAFAPALGAAAAGRLIALVGAAALTAGLLGPAAALFAGAVVASDKAQAMLGQIGGEFQAPRTSWLGIVPGAVGAALVVLLVALEPWAVGAAQDPARAGIALGAALLVPLAAGAWSLVAADRVLPAALREVSALDQVRLAHVDLSTASRLERLWFRALLAARPGRLADKDARLSRRRYPSPYFLGPLGAAILWILAATGGEGALPWAGVILFGLAAYAVLMARRLVAPPIELARLIGALPLSPADVRAAKRAPVLLRALTWTAVGGVPFALGSTEPLAAWLLVVGALLVAAAGGVVAARDDI